MAIRRQLQIKLSKKKHADHPLNKEEGTIAEKAFRLRDFAEQGDALARIDVAS